MKHVIEPLPRPTLAVAGSSARFPVSEIHCVGRNYADHAVEMGGDPSREPPFFFLKPGFAIIESGETLEYPADTSLLHHEVELVVALGEGGRDVAEGDAMALVFGYAVGIDMTRRDLQNEAKEQGRPWESGKSFRHAAPCSAVAPIASTGELTSGAIHLDVNGERRQSGDLNQMIWKVPEIISRLSTLFVLSPGDLIFTGTPAGVAAVERGDEMHAHIEGVGSLDIHVG